MKPAIFFLALLLPIAAIAQAPSQPMTDKVCEQQGKLYVTESNKSESVPDPSQGFYWSFVAAHYDSHTNVCYVMYRRSAGRLGAVLQQIRIDDIESNRIAVYSGTWTSDRDGHAAYSKPTNCEVNGTTCLSISQFVDLLGKFIPAFIKKAPRAPVSG
jgi:hypothetical protein